MTEFLKQMAPVMAANALTILYVYGWWRISKWERERRPDYQIGDLALVIIPPLFLLYGLYLWGALEATPLRHFVALPLPQ